jgi:hypothetical protein
MSTPAPSQNDQSKMKKILNSPQDESVMMRLPRQNAAKPAALPKPQETSLVQASAPAPAASADKKQPAGKKSSGWRDKFLPVFWTVASLISFAVNIVVLIVLIVLLLNRNSVGTVSNFATDQGTQLLGGLYNNFVLMDDATISKTIIVDANIPLDIMVPVNLMNEEITLAQDTVITRAHVEIYQGGVNINAPAKVTLPAGTKLNVDLNFDLPVKNTIPVHLEVPVSIPLNETELHAPFVGLQEVVRPWYCLLQPNALANGNRVCDGIANPLEPVFNLITP